MMTTKYTCSLVVNVFQTTQTSDFKNSKMNLFSMLYNYTHFFIIGFHICIKSIILSCTIVFDFCKHLRSRTAIYHGFKSLPNISKEYKAFID